MTTSKPVRVDDAGVPFYIHPEDEEQFKKLHGPERSEWVEQHGWKPGYEAKPRTAAEQPANDDQTNVKNFANEKAKRTPRAAMLQAVTSYLATGLHCIQIGNKGKIPTNNNWRTERLELEQALSLYSNEPMPNIGIALGESSKSYCDVDLDWPLAPQVAAAFTFRDLPSFGRAGKPMSHRLFRCTDLDGEKTAIVKFELPASKCLEGRLPSEHATCVLEIRANHQQTVFPPSIHCSCEQIDWTDGRFTAPPQRKWQKIKELGGLTAFLTVMATLYPPEGSRNDFNLALGGALLRALMNDPDYKDDDAGLIKDVDEAVQVVCKLGGDKGHGRSWTERAGNTLAKIKAGKNAWALKKVCEILGLDEMVEKRIRQWLGAGAADERPRIVWDARKLDQVADHTQQVLVHNNLVYRNADLLMHVGRLNAESGKVTKDRHGNNVVDIGDGVLRPIGAIRTFNYNEVFLYEEVNRVINWWEVGKSREQPAKGGAPEKLVKHVLRRATKWTNIPILLAIVNTPTILSDGSLLTEPGYDKRSKLLLDTGGAVFPEIKDKPTKGDAIAALRGLLEPFEEFKFDGVTAGTDIEGPGATPSRSVALSNVLTAVSRQSMLHAPMHGFDANAPASGKGKCVNIAAVIATGHPVSVLSWSANDEENEKRIGGCLLRGDRFISIDNAGNGIGGDFLNQCFTEQKVQVRVLGQTGQHDVEPRILWDATGNGLKLIGDMVSRAIIARIDHGVEDPSTLYFKRNLDLWVPEHRAVLVGYVLTILRAYVAADRPWPNGLDNSRFPEWNALVRGALLWLDQPDPDSTRDRLRAMDPVSGDLFRLMDTLANGAEYGLELDKEFSSHHLATLARSHAPLHEALEAAINDGGKQKKVNERTVGDYLRGKLGRVVHGHRIEGTIDKSAGRWRFFLRKV